MKPSPAIVACGCDAVHPAARGTSPAGFHHGLLGLTGSLPGFHGADSRRPIALAALLLTCVLLSAGFFFHEHDDGDPGGHEHNCIICCLPHYAAVASAAAPTPSPPERTERVAERTGHDYARGATLGTRPTRGPPA